MVLPFPGEREGRESGPSRLPGFHVRTPRGRQHRTENTGPGGTGTSPTSTMVGGFVVLQAAAQGWTTLPLPSHGQPDNNKRMEETPKKGGHGWGGWWHGEGGTGTAVIQSSSRPMMRVDKLSAPQRACVPFWPGWKQRAQSGSGLGPGGRVEEDEGPTREPEEGMGGGWRGSSSRSATAPLRRCQSVSQ